MKIVSLTTDFGTRDWFVGTMRGVIFGINAKATVVDTTHDIRAGAGPRVSQEPNTDKFVKAVLSRTFKQNKMPDFETRRKRIFGDRVLPGNIVAEERKGCEW